MLNKTNSRILFFTLFVLLILFPTSIMAQTKTDSTELNKYVQVYQQTFNTRDAAALSRYFTEDADVVVGNLLEAKGRQAVEKWWNSYFAKQEPGRRGTFTVNSLRKITDDVALINLLSVTGGKDTLGAELRTRKARGTWILHHLNDEWFITSICMMPVESDSIVLEASIETAESLRPHIRAFVDMFEDAFNSHNPSKVSALFRNDADIIVRNLPLIQGKQGIQNMWRAYFSKPRNYRALFIIDEIRTISDDVVQVNITTTGAVPGTVDKPQPLRQTSGKWILVRESDGWRIAALRVLPGKQDRIIRR